MSRLTGKEVYSLMEAYQAVYTPQELTEEQVWEGVENWVHSLLEEGYDLSDYTWEEMYESYLSELTYPDGPAIPTPKATLKPNTMDGRYGSPQTQVKPDPNNFKYKSTSDGKNYKNYNDALAANRSRNAPKPNTMDGRYGSPQTQVKPDPNNFKYKSTSDGKNYKNYNDALAANKSRNSPYTSKNLGGAQYGAFKAGGGNESVRRGYSAGEVVQQGRKNISKVVSGREMNVTAPGVVKSSFNMFDAVKGYLIGEGYADTEEAALAIMGNMSEDWKYSILEDVRGGPDFQANRIIDAGKRILGGILDRRPKTVTKQVPNIPTKPILRDEPLF